MKKTKALLAQEAAAKKEAEERQKAEDERIVLVEQEVVLRGNSTVPAGAKVSFDVGLAFPIEIVQCLVG